MLTNSEKQAFRKEIFCHLDGIAVAPIAYSLFKNKVTDYLINNNHSISVSTIASDLKANEGYLNVALRVISAQGWLDYHIEDNCVTIKTNSLSITAFNHFKLYKDAVELLEYSGKFHPRKFELEPFHKLEKLFKKYQNI